VSLGYQKSDEFVIRIDPMVIDKESSDHKEGAAT